MDHRKESHVRSRGSRKGIEMYVKGVEMYVSICKQGVS